MAPSLGKALIILGAVLVVAGLVVLLGARVPWLGRLPGDIIYRRGNLRIYFPIVTSIILSVLATLILYVIARLMRK